jgi:hypothetical protein
MRFSLISTLALVAVAQAISLSEVSSSLARRKGGDGGSGGGGDNSGKGGGGGDGGGGNCPAVWKSVKAELNGLFMTGNQCNDLARAAIRAIFHDCGSWDTSQGFTGGCDGSLILASDANGRELDRGENRGLATIAGKIQALATKYGTTVADMIVFAGSKFHVSSPSRHHLS